MCTHSGSAGQDQPNFVLRFTPLGIKTVVVTVLSFLDASSILMNGLVGLSVGLSVCLSVGLSVTHERFSPINHKRIIGSL